MPLNYGRPYVLAEANYHDVLATDYSVAVLPWGATEAHNYHLPYGTDTIQCDAICCEAARKAWDAGTHVAVLPTVPFGVNTTQLDIKLTINMNPSTQFAVLKDVVASLDGHGITRFVLVNGHGGNAFKQMIRELVPAFPKMLLCTLDWYKMLSLDAWFAEPGDHAGEMETSNIMQIAPSLVRPLTEAGSGAATPFAVQAFREGWAWTPRVWAKVTEDTGVGNPVQATPEKGAAFLEAITDQLAAFLQELAQTVPTNPYESL